MADEAGIFQELWEPDKIRITKASHLIAPLASGLARLISDPDRFKKLNPSNGWGNYDCLVSFVRDYIRACEDHPEAHVYTSNR
jgi:hypothetical protein